jgi:hypothetical protein
VAVGLVPGNGDVEDVDGDRARKEEGAAVGPWLGLCECGVGAPAAKVGAREGDRVGATLGETVGLELGLVAGSLDGAVVGVAVGVEVG